MSANKTILIASTFLLLAVVIGAFGAHALEPFLFGKYLKTFATGSKYHFYHGIALLVIGILQKQNIEINYKHSSLSFILGIFLFSFNCYLYAITKVKIFAMIVPIGGVFFILGWLNMIRIHIKRKL